MVYLIHFDQPIGSSNPRGRAQHYIGFTDNLEHRMTEHRQGIGAKILAACAEYGVGWNVVRTWAGDRTLERQLKNRKKARVFCPVCNHKH